MINETNPSARMLEKNIKPFLKCFSLFVMKDILGLKGLINGQVNRVVGIRYAGLNRNRGFFFLFLFLFLPPNVIAGVVSANNIPFASFPAVFSLHRGGNSLVMGFSEPRGPEPPKERELSRRRVVLQGVHPVIGVLRLTPGRF